MSEKAYEALDYSTRDDGIAVVTLQRPERHNAFDAVLIDEIIAVFGEIDRDSRVRAVLLQGAGKSFSAGADIAWMRAQGEANEADNMRGAEHMEAAFRAIYDCQKPVVARVHGAALGGGSGLTAAADIAITTHSCVFGFSEVRLGIIPAVISPFVIEKLGLAKAKALFLLGSRFKGAEAERVGLVFKSLPDEELDAAIERALADLLQGSPAALLAAKALCQTVRSRSPAEVVRETCSAIAAIRQTAEAREGLAAFLDKRKPGWISERSNKARDS